MKKSFSLISALIIMLLISALMVAVARISYRSVQHTQDTYMVQRAELFMRSVLENSILAIEGYERNSTNQCLKKMFFTDEDERFNAEVDVLRYYCYDLSDCPCGGDLVKKIQTPDSHGYVLLKVVVESNLSNPKNDSKLVRLEKVTLQRP